MVHQELIMFRAHLPFLDPRASVTEKVAPLTMILDSSKEAVRVSTFQAPATSFGRVMAARRPKAVGRID